MLDWHDLCRRPLDIATNQVYKLWLYGFRDEDFPIISLWELYVAMDTRVQIQSAQNPYAAFLPYLMLYIKFEKKLAN